MYFSQRRRLPLWLKGDLDDGIEHQQKRALPEDLTLFGAPGFEKLHHALDVTWFRGLSNSELYQVGSRHCICAATKAFLVLVVFIFHFFSAFIFFIFSRCHDSKKY